jgi:hypothetical protein
LLLLRLVGNSSKPFGCFEWKADVICEFVESCTGYKTRPKIERDKELCRCKMLEQGEEEEEFYFHGGEEKNRLENIYDLPGKSAGCQFLFLKGKKKKSLFHRTTVNIFITKNKDESYHF